MGKPQSDPRSFDGVEFTTEIRHGCSPFDAAPCQPSPQPQAHQHRILNRISIVAQPPPALLKTQRPVKRRRRLVRRPNLQQDLRNPLCLDFSQQSPEKPPPHSMPLALRSYRNRLQLRLRSHQARHRKPGHDAGLCLFRYQQNPPRRRRHPPAPSARRLASNG